MIDALKEMLDRFSDFGGKTDRSKYWLATLAITIFYVIVGIVVSVIITICFAAGDDSGILGLIVGGILTLGISIVSIFVTIAGLSMTIRRLRDAGFPWWFFFINFVPSIGQIALIVFLCFPSSDTPVIDFGGNSGTQSYTPSQPKTSPQENAPVVDVPVEEAPIVEETFETKEDKWICKCGKVNSGNFCSNCGSPKE